jgi:site-specific recombinase XerD
MNKTFNLLFLIKKSKIKANGTVPIYLRITIDGVPKEISSKRYILPEKWESKLQKVSGNSPEVKAINSYLKALEQEVYDAHHSVIKDKQHATSSILKSKILKIEEKPNRLIPIFEDHNNKVEKMVGNGFAPGTLERYKTSLKHTINFMKWKYAISDIDIQKIDHAFITEYEFYLRTQRGCNNNSAVKYIKNFKKIVLLCLANGWLDKNPFVSYKSKLDEVEKDFLSEEELYNMHNKEMATDRLNIVKDIYVFSCYTGLAYIDVKNLTKNNVSLGIDGNKWIFTHRQKTDTASKIPLLPIPEQILEKYSEHQKCENENTLLPILTNQKMNSYLKEIADVCGINKDLTFHTARHTFATTVTLFNGVPIESVSKMLGHTNITTTQHYAKILDKKVSNDMENLRVKLNSNATSKGKKAM